MNERLSRDEILYALPIIKMFDRFPNAMIPPGAREVLKKIIRVMESSQNANDNTIVSRWLDARLRVTSHG